MHPENFHLIFSLLNKVQIKENSIVSLIPLPKYELNKDNNGYFKVEEASIRQEELQSTRKC